MEVVLVGIISTDSKLFLKALMNAYMHFESISFAMLVLKLDDHDSMTKMVIIQIFYDSLSSAYKVLKVG